jgi:hypothetical protein
MAYNIDTYRAFVESEMREALVGTGGPRVFGNRGDEFARIVTDVMIENANERLSFLCGYMSATVYDPERLRVFLQKPNTQLRVLLDGPPPEGPVVSALDELGDFADRIKVKHIRYQLGFHFGIADSAHVRREDDIHDRRATIIFGDEQLATVALTTFDKLWHLSPDN